jgi:hypothetical protein
MKKLLLSCAALWASPALAAEDPSEAKPDEDRITEKASGAFSLLGTECKAEDDGAVETTPGSPPLDVDDTGTPGCRGWEINIVTSGDLGKAMSFETPLFDINYGIGDNIQLKVEAPFQFTRIDGVNHGGIGSAEVGIKHRFFEDEARDLSVAIYPQVEFAIPGTAAADEAEGSLLKFPVLMSTKVGETSKGDVMLTANLAYNMSTSSETGQYISAALGVGFPLTRNIALMVEGTTEQALARNMDGVRASMFKADLGLVGKISPHLMLFGAAGQSYTSSASDDASHTCLVLGFRLLAGGP